MADVMEKIEAMKIVPVVAIHNAAQAGPLVDALVAGGLPCAEITFRTDAAAEAIAVIAKRGDVLVGTGTVLTTEQADQAIDAGASFVVSPGTNPKVVEHCLSRGVPVAPGVATPTDIELAMSLGLEVLKFFPAEAMGGLKTLKAVSAPYRKVRFIPTGGINASNLREYLDFPKVIACGGSWMVKSDLIAGGQFDRITEMTAQAVKVAKGN
jgi:2-dehydro-3-deoxyphosphogluconate aldolase/(4S)-4-hydroxy-2-oxoglutarate aldolase